MSEGNELNRDRIDGAESLSVLSPAVPTSETAREVADGVVRCMTD